MDTKLQSNNWRDDLLVSWKDIALYLKCSVRKAQRLERVGLPVNRIPGTKSVWALKPDIDRWMTSLAKNAKRHESEYEGAGAAGTVHLLCPGMKPLTEPTTSLPAPLKR